MNITTKESRIQSDPPLPSTTSSAVLLSPSPLKSTTKLRSQSKTIFFWLVALSLFYVALQYEEIANLMGAAGDDTWNTPLQTINQNSALHINDHGDNYNGNEQITVDNGFIDWVDSNDAVDNDFNNPNIAPQVDSNDAVDNDLNNSNISPQIDSKNAVDNDLNNTNPSPQVNPNDGTDNNKNNTDKTTDTKYNDTVNSNTPPQSNSKSSLKLLQTDLIYQPERWTTPIVIRKYKLLFYTIPKVACSDWKKLFRRLEDEPEWNTTGLLPKFLHQPGTNNLTILTDYPIEEANEILTSSEWTRAVFLREPKERILSAYLDKYVNNNKFFRKKCCQEKHNVTSKECREKRTTNPEFAYFLNRTRDCPNDHWDPQYSMIDAKWWKTINFVGYMHTIIEDSKRLLQSINFTEDGVSAWEKYGKTGWGENGTNAFMERDTAHHATNAHDKLKDFYTRDDEQFVEKYWGGEWNHTVYHFTPFHLFESNTTNAND